MTCLEKLKQMYPELDDEGIKGLVEEQCPNHLGIMGMPDHCDPYVTCDKCWNREIPGTEQEPTTPVIKDSGSRTEFSTGAVRDVQALEKGRCDLMPLDIIGELTSDPVIIRIADFVETGSRGYLGMALDAFDGYHTWPDMYLEVAVHMAEGCQKYGERNWEKGIPLSRYIDSAVRHYLKWLRHDKDERHDRAFCWNIMCAIWTCKHKPELNCYPINATVED